MDAPSSRLTFHGYILVDVSTQPPSPVAPNAIYSTRQEARTAKQWRADADSLRARRARVTVYES